VTSIGYSAFAYCSVLTSINLSTSLNSIGDNAFLGCSSLKSINLPDELGSIGDTAFSGCSNLATVTCLAKDPPTLGSSVFNNCPAGLQIRVPSESVDAYKAAWSNYANKIEAISEP
jgi:hypothetical protein